MRLLLLVSFLLISCSGQGGTKEMQAAKKLGLKKKDVRIIEEISGEHIGTLDKLNKPYAGREGITIPVTFNQTGRVNKELREIFREKGYLVFLAEQYYERDNKKNVLVMIKSTDTYDILRLQNTNYLEKNIPNSQLIEVLQFLEKKYTFTFEFTGAEISWLTAEVSRVPSPIEDFTRDITILSPELLNDGTGRIEDIQAAIADTKKVYLFFY